MPAGRELAPLLYSLSILHTSWPLAIISTPWPWLRPLPSHLVFQEVWQGSSQDPWEDRHSPGRGGDLGWSGGRQALAASSSVSSPPLHLNSLPLSLPPAPCRPPLLFSPLPNPPLPTVILECVPLWCNIRSWRGHMWVVLVLTTAGVLKVWPLELVKNANF